MSHPTLLLVPTPKSMAFSAGCFHVSEKTYTVLAADAPAALLPAARQSAAPYEVTASPIAPDHLVGLRLVLQPQAEMPAQGYQLTISPAVIKITATTPAGLFYGACTLAQIIRQCGDELPCLRIDDWPDLPVRGFMLDISRDKVPTQKTLYQFVDLLASLKINQLQLYTEHTFAYTRHRTVWEQASPMTGEEILALDAYCQQRFVELAPNQNSFGHMERWLKHAEYKAMAECPDGFDLPWGHYDNPFSISPVVPESLTFLAQLYEELLPHFTSRVFNVGCDETWDLGQGRSHARCEEVGVERVYLEFLQQIHALVQQHDRTMMFWGDIILQRPELIAELPQDAIALEWGYEASHPFAEHGQAFHDAGIPFYVCPGTSSWLTLCGRTENAINNITSAARNGLSHGAIGLLNTCWGDAGHWDPMPVCYLGAMLGAAASWHAAADPREALAEKLSLQLFHDPSGATGKLFYELGNLYRLFHVELHNNSMLNLLLIRNWDDLVHEQYTREELAAVRQQLDVLVKQAATIAPTGADAGIIHEEIAYLFQWLHLALSAGEIRLGDPVPSDWLSRIAAMKASHHHIWLLRNRPGGMEDSFNNLKVAAAQ